MKSINLVLVFSLLSLPLHVVFSSSEKIFTEKNYFIVGNILMYVVPLLGFLYVLNRQNKINQELHTENKNTLTKIAELEKTIAETKMAELEKTIADLSETNKKIQEERDQEILLRNNEKNKNFGGLKKGFLNVSESFLNVSETHPTNITTPLTWIDFSKKTKKKNCVLSKNSEIADLVDLFKFFDDSNNQTKINEHGIKKPQGLLFYGKPGAGKTYFSKYFARELGAHYAAIQISHILNSKVGHSEKMLDSIFSEAEQKAEKGKTVILFFDEIDSYLTSRNQTVDYARRLTNHFLVKLEAIRKDKNIIIIGATNRFESLDEAAIRVGRFDRKIEFHLPTKEERLEKMQKMLSRHNISVEDIDDLESKMYDCSYPEIKTIIQRTITDRAVKEKDFKATFISKDFEAAIGSTKQTKTILENGK